MRPHERVPFRPSPDFNPRTPVGCDGYSVSVPIELRNFNPRTPVGCDRPIRVCFRGGRYFNPRTPVGCDEGGAGTVGEGGKFQSTHPSGVRRHHVGRRRRAGPISIHAPQWGATVVNNGGALAMAFQSTHPSGVRLSILTYCYLTILFQSTHPSGVRLRLQKHFFSCPKYFNPRTPVGCDSTIRGRLMATWLFQSTHPSGVRQPFLPRVKMHVEISIHAPQWGATPRATPRQWSTPDFNPRTPVGCDRGRYGLVCPSAIFQSTHPSGVRPAEMGPRPRNLPDFNPRTPVGCDGSRSSWP